MPGSKRVFTSLDMSKCTKSYSDVQGVPLSQGHESMEVWVTNDSMVLSSAAQTHNLYSAISKLRKGF